MLVSIAASEAFLAAASLVYAIDLLRHPVRPRFPPIKLPLALFCLGTVVSLGWAENTAVGWLAVRKLDLFVIWLLAANLIVSAAHLNILYRALFFESAAAGLVAAGQFVVLYRRIEATHPDRLYASLAGERITGFMGHWMNFGGQQMLSFAALLAFVLLGAGAAAGSGKPGREPEEPKPQGEGKAAPRSLRRSTLAWLALAIVAASIVLNFTRGVWLGCFVAAVYLAARSKPRWLWAFAAFVVLAYFAAPGLVRQRLRSVLHPSSDPSASIRFEMWQAGWEMIRKHPWTGVGPNNVMEVYPLYLPAGKALVAGYHEHLHNDFLEIAAERGLPCGAAWLWLMAALAWNAWKIRRRLAAELRPTWIADAALAAWLAFMVEGCFEFNFGASPVLMTFLFISSTPFVLEGFKPPKASAH